MTSSQQIKKAAILIVNGGDHSAANRWIRLCLARIAAYTDYPNYHIYLWNNRSNDRGLEDWFLAQSALTLISAASYETLNHPHRTPLQRLYHLARQEGAYYIVALDSDAHPLRSGWLTELIAKLDEGAVLAGIWRDNMTPAIRPHVHASCLCTTVDFVEDYQLRFDFDNTHAQETIDTLSHFTWVAEANHLPVYRLPRSNQRQFHEWMGGIYGDLIYHHVAASRKNVVFRNSPRRGQLQSDHNKQLRDVAAEILFNAYEPYIDWLQGCDVDPQVAARLQQLRDEADEARDVNLSQQLTLTMAARPSLRQRIKRRVSLVLKRSSKAAKVVNAFRKLAWPQVNQGQSSEQVPYNPLFTSFQREHLAPLARHGWTVKPPDFVGVGTPKSGTTWWYKLMMEHPQLVDNRARHSDSTRKELQYFLHFQSGAMPVHAIDVYREAFASPPGAICGEFSTQYLAYPTCLEQLALAAPDAKIIVILRNPIDRFVSHLNHLLTKRGRRFFGDSDQQQRYLLNTYSFYTEAMLHSLYSIGLARLFHYYDPDRVLVLQYERSAQFPQEELARTYRFLGVDDRYRAKGYSERIKPGKYVVAKPDAEERGRLAAYFREDVQRVFALCPGLEPGLWPDFAPASSSK